jgi:cellulose biosynthesis protein BcsQ
VSQIVTFYSYKGGVGRSMALANIAVLLARRGLRVLAVDWDLEAPGLERYFDYFELSIKRGGLLPFLVEQHAQLGADGEASPDHYRHHLWTIDVGGAHRLSLLGSGRAAHADYARVLENFAWTAFFERGGGDFLEQLRDRWRADFDIVLIDSRTGVSDAGGICTIQMPDVLVTMFTANYQSVLGVRDIIQSSRAARQRLAYDRMALTILPLPSRFPRGHSKLSHEWLDRISAELGGYLSDWLPRGIEPRNVLGRLTIPHRDEFALGERLAAAEHKTAGAAALTAVYDRIGGLLAADFQDIEAALGPLEPAPGARALSKSAARTIDEPVSASRDLAVKGDMSSLVRHDVFVSYPRAGSVLREWTYRFVESLLKPFAATGRSTSFFIDPEDRPDTEFEQQRSILDRSRVLLVILTPHYLASSWCLAEWQAFEDREQAEGRALIVAIALRGVSVLPGRFNDRAAIDGSGMDLSDPSDATMATLVEQTRDALIATLDGVQLPERAPDPQPETHPASRSVKSAGQPRRILFLAANPLGTGQLSLDVEARGIADALRRAEFRDQLEFHTRWAVTLGDLLRAVREVSPAVVHFSGHASDGLYLEGPDRLPQLVPAKALAQAMRAAGRDLRLVVLNACYSETQAVVLSEVVDCVVSAAAAISDRDAIEFSAVFYESLASGESVAVACKMSQAMISLQSGEASSAMIRLLPRRGVSADTVFFTMRPRTPKFAGQRRRILFLAAEPLGTSQLALAAEAHRIEQVIRMAQFRDQLDLHTRWAVTPADVLRALREVSPALVHFSGHGGGDGLYLAGPDGRPRLLSGEVLTQMIRAAGSDLRVIVLNASYSEKQAAALSEVVDCVVGVVATISDRAAIAFSAGFYDALAAGASVAVACEAGRAMISVQEGGDSEAMIQLRSRQGVRADMVFLTTQSRTPKAPSGKRRASAR